ncbi:MAG TPA: hypothetical protein VH325_02200 [Bryobacteraceae bacterium]|jgi:hypothetical protein|nr:hypothetical protein [Bryobacteraceae bacterium]
MTIDKRLAFLLQSTESLHASTQELHATATAHTKQLQIDADNIRRLANIAAAHQDHIDTLEERLDKLEGNNK